MTAANGIVESDLAAVSGRQDVVGTAVLGHHHTDILDLFDELWLPDSDHINVLSDVIGAIATHIAVERTFLHPVLLGDKDGKALARELLADYRQMERLLVRIDRRKLNSPDMADLLDALNLAFDGHADRSQALNHHVRNRLTEDQLDRVAVQIRAAQNVILSHPHTFLLRLGGPIYKWTTRLASRWDRLRDRTVRNR